MFEDEESLSVPFISYSRPGAAMEPIRRRRRADPYQVFHHLVALQDQRKMPLFSTYRFTAAAFGIPESEVRAIAEEGIAGGWLD